MTAITENNGQVNATLDREGEDQAQQDQGQANTILHRKGGRLPSPAKPFSDADPSGQYD